MDRFNTGKAVTGIEPLYHAIYKLMYNGKLVGYRVRSYKLGLIPKQYEYYDLDLELVKILNQDLKGFAVVIPPNLDKEVNLVPKGKLLVPEEDIPPYRDIEMCDYNIFMGVRHAYNTGMFDTMEDLEKSDYELKVLYNRYNDMLFGGRLPYDVPVYYDSKLRMTAGKCNYRIRGAGSIKPLYYNFFIRLSPSYIERYGETDNFRNVLIHEMIHVAVPYAKHRGEFLLEMERINRDFGKSLGVNITVYSDGAGDYNYKYACKCCGATFEQIRKTKILHRYSCKKCGGDFYLLEDRKQGYIYDKDGKVIDTIKD